MSSKDINVLILEDEIPAYEKLVVYMNDYFGREIIHDWARCSKEKRENLT